jgi:hypothetical protein
VGRPRASLWGHKVLVVAMGCRNEHTCAHTALRCTSQWGLTHLHLQGKQYALKRVHLMRVCKPTETGETAPPNA